MESLSASLKNTPNGLAPLTLHMAARLAYISHVHPPEPPKPTLLSQHHLFLAAGKHQACSEYGSLFEVQESSISAFRFEH